MTSSSQSEKKTLFLFLSDDAWEGLERAARSAGYVRGERVWGLGKWMVAILLSNPAPEMWEDTRPRPLRASTEEMLERGVIPSWDMGDYRRPRCFSGIPEEAKGLSADLALSLGILKSVSFKKATKQSTLASQLWEALGLGWVQYKNAPPPANYKRKPHRKKREDYDWF